MVDLPGAKWGQEKDKSHLPDNVYHSKQVGLLFCRSDLGSMIKK